MNKATLHHGDCFDVLPALPTASVDMVFADLPYGGVTHNVWDSALDLSALWAQLLRIGTPRCVFAFTATQPFASKLVQSSEFFRYDLIWSKRQGTGFANAKFRPNTSHEHVLIFSRATANPMSKLRMTYNPQKTVGKAYTMARHRTSTNNGSGLDRACTTVNTGGRYPTSIISASRDASRFHPTQKPVALLEWLIRTYTNSGDVILDPTMGSGTTGVACATTGRSFIGIEKDAQYFEVASKRIAEAQAAA